MNTFPRQHLERASKIKLLVLDVDGVLTDGSIFISAGGEEVKQFNARDGLGIKLLMDNNIEVAIITARESRPLARRVADLKIKHFYPGVQNKLYALEQLCSKLSLTFSQVAYAGDDVMDLPVMRKAGFSITVHDGHYMAKDCAHWITLLSGGKGAVREMADGLIASQTDLKQACENYLDRHCSGTPDNQPGFAQYKKK